MLLRGHLSLSKNHFSRSERRERLFSRDHGQKSIELETVVTTNATESSRIENLENDTSS
jgi:hypothetical protein